MRIVHTSDWHVGKLLRGRNRADEHRAVLAEVADVVDQVQADAVLVAGDLYDSAAPPPEADEIVIDTLLRLGRSGAAVVVISGNHDNARRLKAMTPLFARSGVTLLAEPARPDDGGVHTFTTRAGERANVALVPFVSQRGIVRAEQLMAGAAFEHAQAYDDRLRAVIAALARAFTADAVNIVMAHAFVTGGVAGGGERAAHLVDEYGIGAPAFPTTANYVALGHLHRAQQLAGATSIHYCGSPLALDFGETTHAKQVNVVDLEPDLPARVTPHALRTGRPLRSHAGTVDELRAAVVDDDAWLRLVVRESHRVGLGDQVRELFGDRVVEVRIEAPDRSGAKEAPVRRGRTPQELFAEYLTAQGVADPQLGALFAELHDSALGDGVAP